MDPKTTRTLTAVALAATLAAGLTAQGASGAPPAKPPPTKPPPTEPEGQTQEPQGQQPLSGIGRTPRPQPNRVLIDNVLGVIGDKAILWSSVRVELDAWREGYTNKNGRAPTPEEARARWIAILKRIESDEALAQAARSLPGTTRDRIDSIVDQWLADEAREEEARAGSINKLRDKLGLLGQTFEGQQEERRTQRLAQLAVQSSLQRRWRDQFALAVTPAEMKKFYDQNLERFVAAPSADLAVIVLRAGNEPEAAIKIAAKLAAEWRTADAAAPDLARKFPAAVALDPRVGVRNHPDDPNQPPIKEFAAGAEPGEVSEPILMRGSVWVLKVLRRQDGRNDRFDDPAVQAKIQQLLVNERLEAEHNRLILKSRKRFSLTPLTPPQRRPQGGKRP